MLREGGVLWSCQFILLPYVSIRIRLYLHPWY
nr:MAG TPA: hypothetical protein [Bacteriophage sp.]